MTKICLNGIGENAWVKCFGFSDERSSLVANVRNLSNKYISPQVHFVFVDLFETVICTKDDENILTTFLMICST